MLHRGIAVAYSGTFFSPDVYIRSGVTAGGKNDFDVASILLDIIKGMN